MAKKKHLRLLCYHKCEAFVSLPLFPFVQAKKFLFPNDGRERKRKNVKKRKKETETNFLRENMWPSKF